MILLVLGFFIAGIPLGIISIVKSSKVKGWRKAVLLPLGIISLIMYFVSFVWMHETIVYLIITAVDLALSITVLAVSAHLVSKSTNQVYTDKTIEHQESVAQTIEKEQSYIDEIKELKSLLDSGAITQEEYDKKKNEILNKYWGV